MAYVYIVNKFDDFEDVFFFKRLIKSERVVEDLVSFSLCGAIDD